MRNKGKGGAAALTSADAQAGNLKVDDASHLDSPRIAIAKATAYVWGCRCLEARAIAPTTCKESLLKRSSCIGILLQLSKFHGSPLGHISYLT